MSDTIDTRDLVDRLRGELRAAREEADATNACRVTADAEIARLRGLLAREGREIARLRADLARVSEELGLPPTIGPAPGEIARLRDDAARLHAEVARLRRHYDAAGEERDLLALLDLYEARAREAEEECAAVRTEAALVLGLVRDEGAAEMRGRAVAWLRAQAASERRANGTTSDALTLESAARAIEALPLRAT